MTLILLVAVALAKEPIETCAPKAAQQFLTILTSTVGLKAAAQLDAATDAAGMMCTGKAPGELDHATHAKLEDAMYPLAVKAFGARNPIVREYARTHHLNDSAVMAPAAGAVR